MAADNVSCAGGDDDNATSRCGQGCSSTSGNGPPLSLNYDQPQLTVVAVALVSVVAATMCCNLLVVFALLRFRSLRNVSNLLIGNLALSDFLLSVAVLPLSAVNECLGRWVFGRTACNVWLLVDVFLCTASIWNLCIIAFDRFTATFYPLWYRGEGRSNTRHALIYASVVWGIAAVACLPPLLGWNDLSANYVADHARSSDSDVADPCPGRVHYRCVLFRSPSYVLYSASVSFFVPCLVTFCLYINILAQLRRRRCKADALKRRSSTEHIQPSQQQQLRQLLSAAPEASPAVRRRDRDVVATTPADDDDGRMTVSAVSSQRRPSAVVTWLPDLDEDIRTASAVDLDDRNRSNDSSPSSLSRPLNGPTAPAGAGDRGVIRPPDDVAYNLQQLNELTPRRSLIPVSNSDTAVNTSRRCSVAETIIHRFSCSVHRYHSIIRCLNNIIMPRVER